MKFNQLFCSALAWLVAVGTLTAKPVTVNDGKKLTNLTKIENSLNEGGAEIDLTVVMRSNRRWPIWYLVMTQDSMYRKPALCAA